MNGERWGVPLETKCIALYLRDGLAIESLDDVDFVYEAEDPYYHAAFLHAFGGRMLDDQENFGMVGPEAAASVALVRDLTRAHRIPEEPSGALVLQLFSSGKAKAAISGPWFAADLKNVHYRVVPLPT